MHKSKEHRINQTEQQTTQEVAKKGEVTLKMNPYEAHLTGGTHVFRVITDPKHWEADTYPYLWVD